MSVAGAIEATLPFLRAEAEARMLDTFDVKLATGGYVYDPVTDTEVEAFEFLFTTRGRVKVTSTDAREGQAGGRTVASVNRELHIPITSPAVPAEALAVCTAVHPTSDPTLLGATLRITGAAPGSQTTARRMQVGEVLS